MNRFAIITTLLLTAYGTTSPALANGKGQSSQDNAHSSQADEAAVRAEIEHGYAPYREGKGDSFELSPAFQRAWTHAIGKDGVWGSDPFCDCQDTPAKFRYQITSLVVNGAQAIADIDADFDFSSYGKPTPNWDESTRKHSRLIFVKTPQGWRLDDLSDEFYKSLKAEMTNAKPGAWGEVE